MYLEVEKTGLGAEHGCSFGLRNKRQSIIILVAQEASLDSCSTGCSLSSIVPDSGHGQVVSDVAFFSVKHFTKRLLQLVPHRLS